MIRDDLGMTEMTRDDKGSLVPSPVVDAIYQSGRITVKLLHKYFANCIPNDYVGTALQIS